MLSLCRVFGCIPGRVTISRSRIDNLKSAVEDVRDWAGAMGQGGLVDVGAQPVLPAWHQR